MASRSIRTLLITAVAACVLSACGSGNAGEDAYFERLDQAGISTGDRDTLLKTGQQTCDQIREDASESGTAPGEVLADFVAGETFPAQQNGYGDGAKALTITLASAISLCQDVMNDDEIDKNWQEFLDGRDGLAEVIGS
ncbi:DUF732 domain-containing protein [Rhodococcus aetherivorans]|uniref:DUF732 domain-containing protein n=1 Tax=Rhodococcus aetherivorans TaxID=191292 RepID=UPI0029490806|nr:DUF732 domain-containing protein [Rhodococcus aetherivorans]MDV6296551.1 DUF732 domain-containing protein [Rhodococcus aetherivorans]